MPQDAPTHLSYEEIVATLPERPRQKAVGLPYPLLTSGKVRDIFDLGENLLIVASDRLSAFDVVLPEGIPGKGVILTQMSLHWFAESAPIIDNHLVADHSAALAEALCAHPEYIPRSMLVRKLKPLPIEAVVRGYISGSSWRDYVLHGAVFGQKVPGDLLESAKLPFPLFTPTTKAKMGDHDESLSLEQCAALLGRERHEEVYDASMRLYAMGAAAAKSAGLILADTKFEFGLDESGKLVLIDEILTPDSSRYWPKDDYKPGGPQPAFDKQFVRDYLESTRWDKSPPAPHLPSGVVEGTRSRYLFALQKLLADGKDHS